MIVRAKVVVTMDGPPIDNGAIVISQNRIVQVGRWHREMAGSGEELHDLGEVALLPGLINAHCHLDYTMLRGVIPRPESFAGWIRQINEHRARFTEADYIDAIRQGMTESIRYGTTSVVNLTGAPRLASSLKSPLRVVWCAELIDLRASIDVNGVLEELGTEQVGLAPHAPFSASASLYRACETTAHASDCLLTTHLAESREEMQMALGQGGHLEEFLRELGLPLHEVAQTTPVQYLAGLCDLDERWVLAHVNEVAAPDLPLLSRTHVVHCPRSHAYFGHSPFQLEKLEAAGANICVGTDSLASNADLSLLAELRALGGACPSLSPQKLLEYVTVNAGRALRREAELGRIRHGYLADMVAVPCFSLSTVYDEIAGHEGEISAILIGGRLIPCS